MKHPEAPAHWRTGATSKTEDTDHCDPKDIARQCHRSCWQLSKVTFPMCRTHCPSAVAQCGLRTYRIAVWHVAMGHGYISAYERKNDCRLSVTCCHFLRASIWLCGHSSRQDFPACCAAQQISCAKNAAMPLPSFRNSAQILYPSLPAISCLGWALGHSFRSHTFLYLPWIQIAQGSRCEHGSRRNERQWAWGSLGSQPTPKTIHSPWRQRGHKQLSWLHNPITILLWAQDSSPVTAFSPLHPQKWTFE